MLSLVVLDGRFAISRLAPSAPAPDWTAGSLLSVTRTADELSVMCDENAVPPEATAERGWRCLKVQGPLPFELTGVLAALAQPLAAAGIPLFAISTYDTDYLFVREKTFPDACRALEDAGHIVTG